MTERSAFANIRFFMNIKVKVIAMMTRSFSGLPVSAMGIALAFLASASSVQGATPNPEEIARLLDSALPPIVSDNNVELVSQMQKPLLGNPLSKTFSRERAVSAVFGADRQPKFEAGCTLLKTPQGEVDPGDCVGTFGTEKGSQSFIQLRFSKNLGFGNIGFLSRGLVQKIKPADLKSVAEISNDKALDLALAFLIDSFGLSKREIPFPPADAKNPNPFVSDQSIGFSSPREFPSVVVRKIVTLPRALELESPIVDPTNGMSLPFIPAPGSALVAIDSSGIVAAEIRDWRDLRINENLNLKLTKTRQQLISEMTEDLVKEGGGTIEKLSAHLVYGSDWHGTYGYLVPAVRISVAPVAGEKSSEELADLFKRQVPTAGFVLEYPLVPSEDTPRR